MDATKDTMHFAVSAEDATALRATLNTLTKLFSTFEKAAEEGKLLRNKR